MWQRVLRRVWKRIDTIYFFIWKLNRFLLNKFLIKYDTIKKRNKFINSPVSPPNNQFMRKITVLVALILIVVLGCRKADHAVAENSLDEIQQEAIQRKCASHEMLDEQMKSDPQLFKKMEEIEDFTQRVLADREKFRLLPNGIIEIPVVVNVLYKTPAQNISIEQIQSQIDVLNQDFSATNSDYNIASPFLDVRSGDIRIRFVLDQIVRLKTKVQNWPINDAMKKSSKGGIDPTSPQTKLNFWVCNLTSGYLGYAQFPGGNASTDGVVIDDNAFGTIGSLYDAYNKGRTATHEVGHWMNLRHIWGDATCGNDLVNDTPLHRTSNFGCPTNATSGCGGTVHPMMTMNYMDYTDDACMFMFTVGQKERMLAIFAAGGTRNSFAQP